MATHDIDTLTKGEGGKSVLPRSIVPEVWKKALETAVVPQLATDTPVIFGENTIPTLTKRPAASIVGEGENKPETGIEIGSKSFRPIKAVVLTEFTMEAVMTNPAGVLDSLAEETAGALSRQIDLAVIHGRQASDGSQIAGAEYLTQSKNVVTIADANSAEAAMWEGYGAAVDKGYSFNGFAASPRYNAMLASAVDKEGRRMYPEIQMGGAASASYAGLPMVTGSSVHGGIDASQPTDVLAIGGDWSALRFGRVLDIALRKIEYGDPTGNGDLQRRNCVAFLAEVIFGYTIMDQDAFAIYKSGKSKPAGAKPAA